MKIRDPFGRATQVIRWCVVGLAGIVVASALVAGLMPRGDVRMLLTVEGALFLGVATGAGVTSRVLNRAYWQSRRRW